MPGLGRNADVTAIQCFHDKVWRHEKLVRRVIVCEKEGGPRNWKAALEFNA